jgi:hypothetical protein
MVAAHDNALFPLDPVAESSPAVIADRGPVNKELPSGLVETAADDPLRAGTKTA